jgi:HD-GYP domain-containing protein (c-di-GMP phosphodiesterase class II)
MRHVPNLQERNEQVRSLLASLDKRVPGEAAHAERVAVYATATGHQLGLAGEALQQLRYASALHDVGKTSLDPGPLLRIGPLSDQERLDMQSHVSLAEALVGAISWLRPCVPAIRCHHERWDGRGYPEGLSGERIPLFARVIAVAEAYDAMTLLSSGREVLSEEQAADELRKESGGQFDPLVVQAFLKVQPLIQPVVF